MSENSEQTSTKNNWAPTGGLVLLMCLIAPFIIIGSIIRTLADVED